MNVECGAPQMSLVSLQSHESKQSDTAYVCECQLHLHGKIGSFLPFLDRIRDTQPYIATVAPAYQQLCC